MSKPIYTIDDLSKLTGWSKSYIYKKTSDGTLRFFKPTGKTIFFNKEWVDSFLQSNKSSAFCDQDREASTIVTLNPSK